MLDMYGESGIKEIQKEARKTMTPSEKRKMVEDALAYYAGKLAELG
jgi:hypothetical protein